MYNPYVRELQNQSYAAPESPRQERNVNVPFYDSSYLAKQPQIIQMVPQIVPHMAPQYIIPMHPQPVQPYIVEPMQMSNIVYPMETQAPPLEPKRDKISWVLYFWLILSLFVLLLINGFIVYHHVQKFEEPSEVNGMADFVVHNLKQDLIEDLKVINVGSIDVANGLNHAQSKSHIFSQALNHKTHDEECPQGYSQIDAGQFHGIESGCICQDGQIHSKYKCWFKSSSQCSIVDKIESHDLKRWSNIKLCAKLIKEWKWVGSQACPEKMKLCQQGLCIRTESLCPLSFLNEEIALPTDPQIQIMARTFKFSRALDQRPIVGFSVTAGGSSTSQCFNQKLSPKFQSGKYYPLANQPQSGCKDEIDDYTIALDEQLQHLVYEQNNIRKEMQDLPFWNNYHKDTDTFHLEAVQRIRLRLHPECDQLNEKMIESIKDQSTQLYNISKWFSISILTIAILSLLFVIICFFIKNKISNLQQTKLIFAFTFICITLMITSYCIYQYQFDKKNGIKETHLLIDKFIAQKCFVDIPLQKMIQELKDHTLRNSLQTEKYLCIGFYLSIVFLFVAIIILVVQNLIFLQPLCLDPWKQE